MNHDNNFDPYLALVKKARGKTREELFAEAADHLKQSKEHLSAAVDIHAQLEDSDGAQGGVPGGNTKLDPEKKKKDPPRSGEKATPSPRAEPTTFTPEDEQQRGLLSILRGETSKAKSVPPLEEDPLLAFIRATRPTKARPYRDTLTPVEKARFDAAVEAGVQKAVLFKVITKK